MSECNFIDEESIDLSSVPINSEEIEVRLDSLHEIDLKIIELLESASESLSLMTDATKKPSSPVNIAESKATFEKSSRSYFELLEEVSVSLRKEIKLLNEVSKDKVLPISVDAKAEWVGKAKESEIYAHIDTLLDIKNIVILGEDSAIKEKESKEINPETTNIEDTDIKMEDIISENADFESASFKDADIKMQDTEAENAHTKDFNAEDADKETIESENNVTGNTEIYNANHENIKTEDLSREKEEQQPDETDKMKWESQSVKEEQAPDIYDNEDIVMIDENSIHGNDGLTTGFMEDEFIIEPITDVGASEPLTEVGVTEPLTEVDATEPVAEENITELSTIISPTATPHSENISTSDVLAQHGDGSTNSQDITTVDSSSNSEEPHADIQTDINNEINDINNENNNI